MYYVVWYCVEDVLCVEYVQVMYVDCIGGGVIVIEIVNYQDVFVVGDGFDQQIYCIIDVGQQFRCVQIVQFWLC